MPNPGLAAAPDPAVPTLVWLDFNASPSHRSLALPLLHAACAQRGLGAAWQTVNATPAEPPGEVAQAVAAAAPDVVAATAWLFTVEPLLKILRRVKALHPACRIILGGPEFLGGNEPFLRREPAVAAVLRGEGEESFPRWLAVWNEPARWGEIPGLCWLDATGAAHDQGRAPAAPFASLPPPWASPFFRWDGPFIQWETARGCLNRCGFCVSGGDRPLRLLDAAETRRRLQELRRHGVRDVRLLDRTFNSDPARAVAWLRLFREECPDTRFHVELHPGLLPAALRAAVAELPPGTLHIEAGVQSLAPELLAACGRHGEAERCREGLAFLCGLRNVEVHADLLAGLPGGSWAQLLADVTALALLGPAEIQLETLKLLPGTPLRDQAAARGLVFAPDPPYELLRTPQMTAAQLQRARRLSRLLDQFYNAAGWREPLRAAVRELGAAAFSGFLESLQASGWQGEPGSLEKRGRLLHAWLAAAVPAVAPQVALAWLAAGLPPGTCPGGGVTPWHGPRPDHAWLRSSHPAFDPAARHLRVMTLALGGARHWFAYDRALSPTRPVAQWQV